MAQIKATDLKVGDTLNGEERIITEVWQDAYHVYAKDDDGVLLRWGLTDMIPRSGRGQTVTETAPSAQLPAGVNNMDRDLT